MSKSKHVADLRYTLGKHVREIPTVVCRGIPIFHFFCPKHRVWVLVRTDSERRFQRVPTIYVLRKNKKNIKYFLPTILSFYDLKNLCILHGHVFIMVMLKVYKQLVFHLLSTSSVVAKAANHLDIILLRCTGHHLIFV